MFGMTTLTGNETIVKNELRKEQVLWTGTSLLICITEIDLKTGLDIWP